MALVGESNERPGQTLFDKLAEERRQAEEEKKRKEEERRQIAIRAAMGFAQQQPKPKLQTPIEVGRPSAALTVGLTSPRVETGVPSIAASTTFAPTVAPEEERETQAPIRSAPPAEEPSWRRTYKAPVPVGAGVGIPAQGAMQAGADISRASQDWWKEGEAGRQLAGQMFNERVEGGSGVMQGFSLGTEGRPLAGALGQVAKASDWLGAARMLPAFQYGADIVRGLPAAGGLSFAQTIGAAGDVLGRFSDEAAKRQNEEVGIPGFWDVKAQAQNIIPNAKILFDSFGDMAQYWQDEYDAMQTGVAPTPEQLSRSSPEQIAQARALSRYVGYSGSSIAAKTFDEYLDNPVLGQEQIEMAAQLLEEAYALPEGPEQDAQLLLAAQMGAQGVRLRDKTPLEIYNENSVWWRELGADLIFDPLNYVNLIGGAGKAVGLLKGGLTPMGRRLAQAARIGRMAENAPMGVATANPVNRLLNTMGEGIRLASSKAKVSSNWNWSTISNLVSSVHTKDDIVAILGELIANPQRLAEQGIDIARLTSPDAILQAADGFFRFGWAGIKNEEFVKG